MKQQDEGRWARLRFAVVGPLLAPPPHGGLRVEVERLAQQEWRRDRRTDAVFLRDD